MLNRNFPAVKILILFAGIVSGSIYPQQSEVMKEFYKAEQKNWSEFVINSRKFAGNSNYDVSFYYLKLDINLSSPYIKGSVLCKFTPAVNNTSRIKLDLQRSFMIDSITGNTKGYIFAGDSIVVQLDRPYNAGQSAEVTVYYRGVPPSAGNLKGLVYKTHGNSEPVIASLSTPFLAYYWWPCKDGPGDKPDSVYVDITVPDIIINGIELTAVSNGVLKNVIVSDNKKTFQWRHLYPIVPYYVMVAVSNYRKFQQIYTDDSGTSFPLDYYVFNENLEASKKGVEKLPDVIKFYSSLFGPYPFKEEKYGMTELGFYSAIENQTNTVTNKMNDIWFSVSVHELAHMWFGCMITCKDWHHGWHNEGFATYCEALWAEYSSGIQGYKTNIAMDRYLNTGTLYLQDISDPFRIFIDIIYSKGAYVLHMLRGVLGDSTFFKCLYKYSQTTAFRYSEATTEDFRKICEEVSGRDLGFFFDQWVYDYYYPTYLYDYSQDQSSGNVNVIIKQNQSGYGWRPVFRMPVQMRLHMKDRADTTVCLWNDQQIQQYNFPVAGLIETIELDPDNWILKESVRTKLTDVKDNEQASSYSLLQNYPNPFNPVTNISFSIPEGGNVKLTVYDILGNEAALLLDEYRAAGSYTIEFNAGKFTSGVYFYRLEAGSYRATRKFVLAK